MKIDLRLWSNEKFIIKNQIEYMVYGLFYGILLIMVLYNFFLFLSLKDGVYLHYVFYVIMYIVVRFSLDGFTAQYLLSDHLWLANKVIPFFTTITIFAAALFIINFLETKSNFKRLHPFFLVLMISLLGMSILSLFIKYKISIQIAGAALVISCFIFFVVGIFSLLSGYRPARFFVLAWSFLLIGNIVFTLNRFGLLPSNFITDASMHLGSVIEVVLLSLALGDKINLIKQEKEEAQRQSIENLHQSDKLKDEFLANTSHELRTPLNGIIGIADSLIDGAAGTLTARAVQNLALISSSGRRLSNMVNDILDYSKLQHMDLQLSQKPLEVTGVIDSVLELSRSLVGNKDLKLKNISDKNVYAYGDENRLQQIVLNLVGNAVKFTHSGKITVSAVQKNDIVEIAVTDTGIGIPENALERIFESFEQADGSTAREYGGTGLGLSLTKQLIELHGGSISVESKVGTGSTFRFTLPSSDKSQADKEAQIEKTVPGGPVDPVAILESAGDSVIDNATHYEMLEANRDYDRALVHIVDDDPVNLQVLENHLQNYHYDVVKSMDGPGALEEISRGNIPDLMLLDIMMPKMSGYEVSKALRERYSMFDLPIMMLTAKTRIDDMVTGFNVGANDYLTKPFDKNELLSRVKTLVTLKMAVSENKRLFSIDKEFEVARKILQTAIPEGMPAVSNLDISVKYIPMESVGGDFYDFHVIDDNRLGVFISDVSGHGVAAALIASMVKIVFSIVEQYADKPVDLLYDINHILMGNIGTNFLTASYFYVDMKAYTLKYARAGHEPLVIFNRNTGKYNKYLPKGRAIGLMGIGTADLLEISIEPGDRIFMYTDGIIEAMNPDSREMYGSKRLMETIKNNSRLSAQELTDHILGQMFKWTGRSKSLDDDFTLVVVDIG